MQVSQNEMTQFMTESEICNIKFGSPDWEIADDNQDTVLDKIADDNSMFEKQDAVTSKVGS